MATVYSVVLFELRGLSGTELFTVPAGFKVVLRDLDVYYGGSITGQQVYLQGNSGQTIWFNNFSPGGGQYASWRGRQVIDTGGTFRVTTTDNMDVSLSGYQLTLP